MEADAGGPIADLLTTARAEEAAIRSRWQQDAVPPWRRMEPTMVCEVRVTNLDLSVVRARMFRSKSGMRVSVSHWREVSSYGCAARALAVGAADLQAQSAETQGTPGQTLVPARTRLDGAVAVEHSSGTVTVRSSVSPWSCQ